MCLGIPGRVVEISESTSELRMGKVSFGGLAKEVCLAYTPEICIGDYVLVHAGFAISKLDEDDANELFRYLAEMEQFASAEDAMIAGQTDETRSSQASEPRPSEPLGRGTA